MRMVRSNPKGLLLKVDVRGRWRFYAETGQLIQEGTYRDGAFTEIGGGIILMAFCTAMNRTEKAKPMDIFGIESRR